MFLRRTVAATALAVSAADAKDHLRVTASDDDYLVSGILAAAIDAVGEMSGRVLAQETWELSLASATGDVPLPKGPVIAVTGISYYDTSDVLQAATVADFYLFKDDDKAVLRPKPGKSWPGTITRDDAIKITFTAGYTAIPPALRSAVLLMLAHLYENREATITGATVAQLPLGVESLVSLYRLGWAAA